MYQIKTICIIIMVQRTDIANVNVNFTVWHTTKMFGGTCASTSHPQFCIMPTGHELFTSSIMQITVITITKVCHHEMVFIHFETFMR